MSIIQYRGFVALCLLLTFMGARQAFAQTQTVNLVTIESGNLPIILSTPHGGRDAIPGVAERKGQGVASFKTLSDFNTDKLAERLADAIEEKLGKRPYVVIARFHRKYVDGNRRQRDAYESEQSSVPYDTYHRALEKARRDVTKRWGRGILLDIHGQAANPKAIFRGTQNGQTTTHLINRFGHEALIGKTSLFGQLARQGIQVIPAVDSADREHDRYDGGYIVGTYGSRSGGTVDAIQLELGRELRATNTLSSTASRLAESVAAFANEYLPSAQPTLVPASAQ